MYEHYRGRIKWNRIFCGKAKLDPVHVWFYGDGIWIQWKRKQNWILYLYGFMETGYGYSGKKAELDPIFGLMEMGYGYSGKKAEFLILYIYGFMETGYGYSG